MSKHNMLHCLIPDPQLERLLDQNGKMHPGDDKVVEGKSYGLWPTSLMVCRRCWEVRLMSHTPRTQVLDGEIVCAVLVVNSGDGSCEEEENNV